VEAIIRQLKQEIDQKLGFEIQRQADVRYLHQSILSDEKLNIGFNTLRRFFGFLPEKTPQLKTLDVLSQFLGYKSYSDFLMFNNKDQNWTYWTFVNDFENLDAINSVQIQKLIGLKPHPDYVLFLSQIVKAFIHRNRIDLLKVIFSNHQIYFQISSENFEVSKLAYAVSSLLRTLPKSKYEGLEALLSDAYVFKTHILDFHIDYAHFNGYYGYLNSARFAYDNQPNHRIFINLIKNYHLFLSGKSNFEICEPAVSNLKLYSVLHGRLLGYQLLTRHFKSEEAIDAKLSEILKTGESYSKVLFYIEIIPALIFTKQLEVLEKIFNRYKKELLGKSSLNYYVPHNTYLIASVLIDLKRQNYKNAQSNLSTINLESNTSNSYYHYLKLFYCIVAYQLEKQTNANPKILKGIGKNYKSLVKATGFKRFNLTLLKKY
jgi:hypothetical protein